MAKGYFQEAVVFRLFVWEANKPFVFQKFKLKPQAPCTVSKVGPAAVDNYVSTNT